MPFPDPDKKITDEAMQNPQIGDEFTEMYVYFFIVIARAGDTITIMEAPRERPCELPRDGVVRTMTLDGFREYYSYSTKSLGYWVRLCKRGINVKGWIGVEAEPVMQYDI